MGGEAETVSAFYVGPVLLAKAAVLARAGLDRAAVCQHVGAVLVCAEHPTHGPLCAPCVGEHIAHLLGAHFCSMCRREAGPGLMSLPAGESSVLALLCPACRADQP